MSPSEVWDTGVPLDFSGLTLASVFMKAQFSYVEKRRRNRRKRRNVKVMIRLIMMIRMTVVGEYKEENIKRSCGQEDET